jgi:hypothetical protein
LAGAPTTSIAGLADGLADGLGRDGVAGARVRAAAAVRPGIGRGPPPPAVDAQAATPPPMTATAANTTIHTLSRMMPALVPPEKYYRPVRSS